MTTIISGPPSIQDYSLILHTLTSHPDPITQVFTDMRSGPGVFAYRWAMETKKPVKLWKPDWLKLGKPAQMILCFEMAAHADALLAFDDGTDHVTSYQIKIAKQCTCKVHVVHVERKKDTLQDYGREQARAGHSDRV